MYMHPVYVLKLSHLLSEMCKEELSRFNFGVYVQRFFFKLISILNF